MNLVLIYVFVISLGLSMTAGFVPISRTTTTKTTSSISRPSLSTELFINIGDQERDKLTRESEPGDYFKTWVDTTMNVFLDGSVRIHTQLCANVYIYIYMLLLWLYRNTDKMTDAEKLPIAIAGIAFITLPFLAGMIALYAAK